MPASRRARVAAARKPLLIWLVFVVIGPPLGLLAILAVALARNTFATAGTPESLALPWHWPPFSASIDAVGLLYGASMLFGGLQAAFVGFAAAASYLAKGRVLLWAVLASALVAYVVFILMVANALTRQARPLDESALLLTAIPHIAAAVGCWLIVAHWRRGADVVKVSDGFSEA